MRLRSSRRRLGEAKSRSTTLRRPYGSGFRESCSSRCGLWTTEALCQLEPLGQRGIDLARKKIESVAEGIPSKNPDALPSYLKRAVDRVRGLSLTNWEPSSERWWLDRQGGNPRHPSQADVAARLHKLIDIACVLQVEPANASHPSIAAALLRQEIWKDYPDFAAVFAKVILDVDQCPNARGMPYEVRKQYQELAARIVPADNPLLQPETYYLKKKRKL